MNRSADTPSAGARVLTHVRSVQASGVIVVMADGAEGYINRRQLSLLALEPETIVQPGQALEAVIVRPATPGQLAELSRLPLLEADWERMTRALHVGDVCQAVVRVTRADGAYVTLEPDVPGFVPRAEYGAREAAESESLLWPDDLIEGVLLRIDQQRKLVVLSIGRRVQMQQKALQLLGRMETAEPQPPLDLETSSDDLRSPERRGERIVGAARKGSAQDEMKEWLLQAGTRPHMVSSLDAFLQTLRSQPIQRALVDGPLVAEWDSRLWQLLGQEFPHLRLAITAPAAQAPIRPAGARVDAIFQMPEEQAALAAWLAPTPDANLALAFSPPARATRAPSQPEPGPGELLSRLLEGLGRRCRAEMALLFRRDPVSLRVQIVAQWGAAAPDEAALANLAASPVGDVIERAQPMVENDAIEKGQKRARYLLEAFDFESFLGLPVPVWGRTEHALFLFSGTPGRFAGQIERAEPTAERISALLERTRTEDLLQQQARLLVQGELIASINHDLHGDLEPLRMLLEQMERVRLRLGPATLEEARLTLGVIHDRMTNSLARLKESVDSYRAINVLSEQEVVDCVALLVTCGQQVKSSQPDRPVKITVRARAKSLRVRGSRVGLQVAFLNLLLNAAQQMAAKDGRKRIEVTVNEEERSGQPWISIRFEDVGPGIHRRLWESIFTLGVTSRPGGSGLGLYICRKQVEAHGGMVQVEQSRIQLGTTFLVELPVAAPEP